MKESVGCGCFPTGNHYPGISHLLRATVRGIVPELDANAAWYDMPIAVLDTETTGRDPQKGDRIVEIGIVVGQAGQVLRRVNWLINPGIPIPQEAREVHGISDDDVRDAPSFEKIAAEVAATLRGAVPSAYNASFDRAFVLSEMNRSGLSIDTFPGCLKSDVVWIDPLVWARELHRHERSKKLGDVAARLGISLENAHRAADDAEATLRVMYAFASDPRVPKAYGALVQEQRRLAKIQEDEFRLWRSRQKS